MNRRYFVTSLFVCILVTRLAADEPASPDPDIALEPETLMVNPWRFHIPPTKRQGVPGIERTRKGRPWVVYGRDVESIRNYQVVKYSDNNGRSWSKVKLMIDEREKVTYSDGVQGDDGTIHIIHHYNRTTDGAVLRAVFTEEDARAGRAVTANVRLQIAVARLPQEQE